MTSFGICTDTSEAVELSSSFGLFLKPVAKINITVQLPALKSPGKSISNWELMEKLKKMIMPDQFLILKVTKTTLEFVKFEGEVENKSKLKLHVGQLDGKTMKLSGFTDALKVRAGEAKMQGTTKHDWESFFRDAKDMNELKVGERPDTVLVKDLPCRWFANKTKRDVPDERIIKEVFESFGEINCMDVPILDPYRKETQSGNGMIQTFSFGQDFVFEAFIQFKEYNSFAKAMTSLRGMKLLYKEGENKALTANIKVDFDRTKHLSERVIRKRQQERDRHVRIEREEEERLKREKEEEARRKEEEIKREEEERKRQEEEELDRERKREEKVKRREERRMEREEKRRKAQMEKKQREAEKKMQLKIAIEERRIVIARRKLEAIRMFSELFERIKAVKQQEEVALKERELAEERLRQVEMERKRQLEEEREKVEKERMKRETLEREEAELRERILKNIRTMEEKKKEQEREELRKRLTGGSVRLKSAVVIKR